MRLTRSGWGLLAGAIGLYVAGVLLGYPDLLAAPLIVLVAIAGSALWTTRDVRLSVQRVLVPDRVGVGGDASGHLVVVNAGRSRSPAVLAYDTRSEGPATIDVPPLQPGERGEFTYELDTRRRGVYAIGPLSIVREDPFGIWRRTRRYGEVALLRVHPRIHPLRPLPSGTNRSLDGPSTDTAAEGTITFHGLREYVVGDDLRRVHWPSTARLGTMMVKQHVDTSRPRTVVVLDTRPSVYENSDAFEHAIEAAASVIVVASNHQFPIEIVTTGGARAGDDGTLAGARALLDFLAAIAPSTEGSIDSAAHRIARRENPGSLVVVTGNVDATEQSAIAAAGRRFDRCVFVRMQESGPGAPAPSGMRLVEATSGSEFAFAWNLVMVRR